MAGQGPQEQPGHEWWRPVVSGIGALVAVSLAIGLVVGLVALGASRLVTGGGGGDTASSSERLEIPDPSPGDGDRDDLHLRPTPLAPSGDDEVDGSDEGDAPDEGEESDESDEEDREQDEGPQISLSASPLQVSAMQRIDIRGTYPGAEGATVEVQRREGGSWQSFSGVSAQVSGGTFSTWVQTGRSGRNVFRVYDASADVASEPVVVRVG